MTVSLSDAVTLPITVIFSSTTNVSEDVNTGFIVSVTLTVLVAVPALSEASVAVYVNVYSPTVSVSTVPEVTTSISPDKSVAVAPASVYVSPSSVVAGLSPVTVTSGAVVSTTLTVLVAMHFLKHL